MFPPPQENNLSLGASKPTPGMLSTEFTKLHSVNAESRAPGSPQDQDELLPTHVDKGKGKPGSYRARVVLLATYVYIFGVCAIFALSLGSIHEWFGLFRRLGNRAGMIESRKSFRLFGTQGELAEQWPGHDEWTSKNCENSWEVRRRANAWSDASANITLNPYTRSHLLVAQHTNGHVTFTVNPQNVEHILVSVFANFHPAEEFNGVKVCKIGKADGSEGIGFSISEKWNGRAPPRIDYWTTVYLPRQSFKYFETDMPFWSHTFEDLRGEVNFDYLKLKSSPSPIVSRGLSANRAHLTTTDSAIGGQFRVYEVLNLETRYGGIFADVEMLYHPYSSQNKSALYMKSEIGLINATTKLMHARERDKGSTGGTYNINAFSARGKIELKVLDSPLLSQLDLQAQSSYSNRVVLHPSYEGSFAAETGSRYDREIRMHQYGPNDDPTGEGRARAVSISKDMSGLLEGNAYWSYENRDKGTVVVKTSQSARSTVDLTI